MEKKKNVKDDHPVPEETHECQDCGTHNNTKAQQTDKTSEKMEDLDMFVPPEAKAGEQPEGKIIHKPEKDLLKVSHKDFIKFFPTVKLPQILNEESIHTFNQHNMPFSLGAELTFLREPDDDEFTEYLPCFRVKTPHGIHVLVFWKAGLMDQHYYVLTMDKKGNIIAKAPIAGIRSDGEKIARLYAMLDEDWVIHMTAGEAPVGDETQYTPQQTKAFEAEILPDGQIVIEEVDAQG